MTLILPSSRYDISSWSTVHDTDNRSQTTSLSASRLCILLAVLALYFVLPLFLRRSLVDKEGHPIPPGPLLRYAFLRRFPERTLGAWAATYGPLFSVWMGNQLFVVISDARIAKDLLVSNGAIFSSRKQYFMKNQTILHGRAVTSTPYNETWLVVTNDSMKQGADVLSAGESIAGSLLRCFPRRRFRVMPPSSTTKRTSLFGHCITNQSWALYQSIQRILPDAMP